MGLTKRISFCGIKHAGKTSAARALAKLLNQPFADTDDALENAWRDQSGAVMTCREIYRTAGEEAFRRLEAQTIRDLIRENRIFIFALGGGALSNPFLTEEDRKGLGVICWLDPDDRIAYKRILAHGLPPFLQNAADPFAAFCEQNKVRRKIFETAAHIVLHPAGNESASEIASLTLKKYKELLHE